MNIFTQKRFALLFLTAAVGAVLWLSCGDGGNPGGGGGGSDYVSLGGLKWMKKNLNVPADNSWCYDDNSANCDKYGRLYTWEAAKSACQSVGMRLPTDEDWVALVTEAGGENVAGKKLRSKSGWKNREDGSSGNGTDNYGFSALPGGYRDSDGIFDQAGDFGRWWTDMGFSDGIAAGGAIHRYMYYFGDYVDNYFTSKSYGYSVRCVKN